MNTPGIPAVRQHTQRTLHFSALFTLCCVFVLKDMLCSFIHFAVLDSRFWEHAVVVSSSVWDSVKSAAVVASEVKGAVKFISLQELQQPMFYQADSLGGSQTGVRNYQLVILQQIAGLLYVLFQIQPSLLHRLISCCFHHLTSIINFLNCFQVPKSAYRVFTRSPLLIHQIVEFSST